MRLLRWFAVALLCLAIPAFPEVQSFQVTIGSSTATQIIIGATYQCRWVMFQNNATHNMRIGDRTISSTKGMQLQPNAWFFIPASEPPIPLTALDKWYVAGTQGDVIDITCESGQ